MEKKQKSLISILLLVVGVTFILIAGGIFVTTAWEYLPLFAKQLALLLVAGFMFGGSYGLSKNEKLGWISDTLFHLGNAFVGFFIIAIMGGVVDNNVTGNALKVLVASGTMAIPVGIKLFMKKGVVDFVALALLVDAILFSGCIAGKTTFDVYMYLLAGFVIGLAVLDALQYKAKKHDSFAVCVGVTYLLHACAYSLMAGVISLGTIESYVDEMIVINGILQFFVVVGITAFSWNVRKNIVIRVFNSLASLWFAFITVNGMFHIFSEVDDSSIIMVVTTVLVSVLMVCMKRIEITGLLIAAAVVIPYGQLLCYFFDAWSWWNGTDVTWTTMYHPYSVIIGVAMVALFIVKYGLEDMDANWKESRLLTFAGAQMLNGIILWTCSKTTNFWGMAFFLLVTVDWLLVAMLFKNKIAKNVFNTFAMIAFVLAVMNQPFVTVENNYLVEWYCFLFGIMIVLFRYIWYDKKDKLSMVYFVETCLILIILLLHNLSSGELGNVMILGMTGIVMLVVSAMKNEKRYVVASSATLILLVLYLTREFWLSIAWWVYLFVAGVVLVLLAVKKAKEA